MKNRIKMRFWAAIMAAVMLLANITYQWLPVSAAAADSFVFAESDNSGSPVDAMAVNGASTLYNIIFAGSGSFAYKKQGDSDYTKVTADSAPLSFSVGDSPETYTFQYTGSAEQAIQVTAEGLDITSGTYTYIQPDENIPGSKWYYQWELEVEFSKTDSQESQITFQAREADLQLHIPDSIVPRVPSPFYLTGVGGTKLPVSMTDGFQFVGTDQDGNGDSHITIEKKDDGYTLCYTPPESDVLLEHIKVKAMANTLTVAESKEISVTNTPLSYGVDFQISSETEMYWDGTDTIYHNGTGFVHILKGQYSEYRYHFGNSSYTGAFQQIGDKEAVSLGGDNEDTLYLQMSNTDPASPRFGSINAIKLSKDIKAPDIKIYKNDVELNPQEVISLKEGDIFSVKAVDQAEGSGAAKLSYMAQESGTSETILAEADGHQEAISKEMKLEDGVYDSLTLYAFDNLGNANSLKLHILVDTVPPQIEITKGKAAFTYDGDANIYVSEESQEALSVTYSDTNLDKDSCAVEQGAAMELKRTPQSEEVYTVTYGVSSNGKCTFYAKDQCGNETRVESPNVIVDGSKPQIDESSVVLRNLLPVTSPFGKKYSPDSVKAFHVPVLDFKFSEEHFWKAEVQLGEEDNVVQIPSECLVSENNKAYSCENVDLSALDSVVAGDLKILVYDKSGNREEYTVPGKVTYIKEKAVLSEPVFDNATITKGGKTYVVTENGKAYMSFQVDVQEIVPELLELRLIRITEDGSRKLVKSCQADNGSLTVSGGEGTYQVTGDYTFDSVQDGGYVLEAYYTDIAGEEIVSRISSRIYYIDMTPVSLSVSSPQVKDGDITNRPVTVVYTMKELNPEFIRFEYSFSSTVNSTPRNITNVTLVKPDGSTEAVPISELAARVNTGNVWKSKGDTYTLTLIYQEESVYNTKLVVKDVMGSEAESSFNFTVDKAAPVVENVSVRTAYEDKNKEDYSKYDENSAVITVRLREEIASGAEIGAVCIAKDDITGQSDAFMMMSPRKDKDIYIYTLNMNRDFKGTLTFMTQDKVNKSSEITVSMINGVIIEGKDTHKEHSEFSITENGKPNENGFYRDKISLKLSASDSYSGIKSIEYNMNNKTSQLDFSESRSIKTSWQKTPVYIEADKENEGNSVKAAMTVVDNAGHKDYVEKKFKLDMTKPEISVSYSNNSSENDKYYNDDRIAEIKIAELNYDSEQTKVTVIKDGVSKDVTAAFHTDGDIRIMEDGTRYKEYTMSYSFEEDGEYAFRVETVDLAGNRARLVQENTFVIDKTAPKMELTFDNNSPFQEDYYGEGRTATLTVTEHNFDPTDILVNVQASLDNGAIPSPKISAFATEGDVHTARISFSRDGDYTISVSGVDMAGNRANDIGQQSFTVDLTEPEIRISGVSENLSYNAKVAPVVTVTDGNYDTNSVVIEITGGKNGQIKNVEPAVAAVDHGQSYSFPDLQYVQSYDDCYVIKATATDKAGHQAESTVSYRVNRFGSTYTMNASLQAMTENYYGHASDDFSIIETNVDELDSYEVSFTLDNEIVNLEEGRDYRVTKTKNDNQWQQYEYSFNASAFEREGVYVLSISSVDAAGNITDNKAKNMTVEFCIDNTAPSCIISGVSEGQVFAEDEEILIGVEVYDNIEVETVSVYVNGDEKYEKTDMPEGKISGIEIDRELREQTIEVVAKDPAGNERREAVHFTYEGGKPAFIRWLMGVQLWIWLAVLGAAGVTVFIVLLKRKKKNA